MCIFVDRGYVLNASSRPYLYVTISLKKLSTDSAQSFPVNNSHLDKKFDPTDWDRRIKGVLFEMESDRIAQRQERIEKKDQAVGSVDVALEVTENADFAGLRYENSQEEAEKYIEEKSAQTVAYALEKDINPHQFSVREVGRSAQPDVEVRSVGDAAHELAKDIYPNQFVLEDVQKNVKEAGEKATPADIALEEEKNFFLMCVGKVLKWSQNGQIKA